MSAVASGVSGRSAAMVTGMAGVSGRRRYTELRSIPAPRDVRWDHRWPLRLGAPSRESTMLPHSLCSPGLLTARGWGPARLSLMVSSLAAWLAMELMLRWYEARRLPTAAGAPSRAARATRASVDCVRGGENGAREDRGIDRARAPGINRRPWVTPTGDRPGPTGSGLRAGSIRPSSGRPCSRPLRS